MILRILVLLVIATGVACAQAAKNVLVVVNKRSAVSQQIGQYYVHKREIPLVNVCYIDTAEKEVISRDVYNREISGPIGGCLEKSGLAESVLYIVMTLGAPLRIEASAPGKEQTVTDEAAVDSELTLLYLKLHGKTVSLVGALTNPFFGHVDAPFKHPNFPMYLVTRLAAWDFADVQKLIDRSLAAKDVGNFVVDVRGDNNTDGNRWLRGDGGAASAKALDCWDRYGKGAVRPEERDCVRVVGVQRSGPAPAHCGFSMAAGRDRDGVCFDEREDVCEASAEMDDRELEGSEQLVFWGRHRISQRTLCMKARQG